MYWDMLSKIKNAARAKREVLFVPFSQMDFAVAKILTEGKFIKDAQKKMLGRQSVIELKLNLKDRRHAVSDFKIISTPSRHLYFGYRDLKSVKQGFGMGVLSTPKGVMSHREAKKQKMGGEYLFEVW